MSKITSRTPAALDHRTVDDRLARLLDAPTLLRAVPHLAPETLQQLIRYRGLEACGDLVAAATGTQLTALLDLDLWRRAGPRGEEFDVARFGEWLDVLVETGESVAARTVAALDRRLVIAGLSRHVRVFDPGTFEPTESSDDERIDRHEKMNSETDAGLPECEVGGYLVRARRTDAWDAIVALLVALDTEYNEPFHALMKGCRRLSNSAPEADGLDDLLLAPDQHLLDTAIDRERRQSGLGYVTPADARAFLQTARHAAPGMLPTDAMAASYCRALDDEVETAAASTPAPNTDDEIDAAVHAVIELLTEAGVRPPRVLALPGVADEPNAAARPVLTRLLEFIRHHDEHVYLARGRELAFLANTLLAGCSIQSRPFTPAEATDAAASVCNLGLECRPGGGSGLPDAFLARHTLVAAFAAGWSAVYRDVSLFVADRLAAILEGVDAADAEMRRDLHAFRRALAADRAAPWLARGAADVLATLDATAWVSVLGLLDECPVIPAALTAILERRATTVSPTAFAFISTRAQLADVRIFMRALPDLL